jgi:hypothetical protein
MSDEVVVIPAGSFGGGSLPVPSRSDRADLIDKIKPELSVDNIRHRLMGEEFKNGVWVEVPALKERKLSEVGAWEISNLMLGVSTISVSISNLKDYEIKQRLLSIAKTAQYLMLANWRAYGMKNTAQQNYVHEIVFSNTLVVLKQAGDASIQELLKATVTENRNIQSERKEGTGSRIKRALGLA